jgi:hypothetical protein
MYDVVVMPRESTVVIPVQRTSITRPSMIKDAAASSSSGLLGRVMAQLVLDAITTHKTIQRIIIIASTKTKISSRSPNELASIPASP